MSAAMPPFHWHGTMAEFDAEIRRRWIESSDRLGLDHGMPNAAAVLAAQDARPAPELGLPYSRCPRWSHPADDFHGQCVTYAGHGGEHENEHGIRWAGPRWPSPEEMAAPVSARARPAPELAALLAYWRKTADSLKHRGGVGNARERNTLEVVIGQVEAILTRPTEPAPELAAHREFTGEILGELRQALGADPDSDAEPGEAPEAHAIRLVHYLKERIDELHGLIAEGEPLSVKPSDDVKPAPELAAAVRVAETVLDLLDDFTHAVIDYRGTSPAITAAAVSVRRKAGLPPVEGK